MIKVPLAVELLYTLAILAGLLGGGWRWGIIFNAKNSKRLLHTLKPSVSAERRSGLLM